MALPKFNRKTGLYTLQEADSYAWLTETTHPSDIENMSDDLIQQQALIWAQAIMDQAFEDLEVEFVVWDEHNGFTEDNIQQHLLDEMPSLVAYLVEFMEGYQVRPFSLETALEMIKNGAITECEGLYFTTNEGGLGICLAYTPQEDEAWYALTEYSTQHGITSTCFRSESSLPDYLANFEIQEVYYQEWGGNDWIVSPLPEAYK